MLVHFDRHAAGVMNSCEFRVIHESRLTLKDTVKLRIILHFPFTKQAFTSDSKTFQLLFKLQVETRRICQTQLLFAAKLKGQGRKMTSKAAIEIRSTC